MKGAETAVWREERRVQRRDLIRRTAQLLSAALPMQEVLGQLAVLLSVFVEATNVLVAVGDEREARVEYSLDRGVGGRPDDPPIPPGSPAHHVLQTGEPVLVQRPVSDVFVPILFGGDIVGVLSVHAQRPDAYDDDDVAMLESCAIYLGVRINDEAQRAQLDHLKEAAATDALTGLPNRRSFDEALLCEWQRCSRSQSSLSVLLLDVDFFKIFNDTYGHIAGDSCLKQIAQAIAECVKRPGDVAARYGGEEFAVVLPETNGEDAAQLGENICAAVRALQIPHQGSSLGYATISVGCACIVPHVATQSQSLTLAADAQLYIAKEGGRNRVASEAHHSESLSAERRTMLRHNLPAMRTSFLGREEAIAAIVALLETSQLATIAGPGGVGKTRLAIELAQRKLEHYPDGVWFVDLAPVTDPAFVSPTILATLGVREEPGREIDETLVNRLLDKNALLVLDNCEHLVLEVAGVVDRLLARCPLVQIIVTSREVLDIAGESIYRVPTFDLEESVALFASRARAVSQTFSLIPENRETVEQICKRLDGIPLAIELAAARVKVMTVTELRTRLDDRFQVLAGGGRTVLPRQQTMRGVIAWSYNLLGSKEKVLFRRLATFAGDFSLDAATSICTGDPIEEPEFLDLFARLVDKSLIQSEPDTRRQCHRLLDLTKEFGRECLSEAGENAILQRRHAEYFRACAETAWAAWRTPAWDGLCSEITAAYADYRAVLQWALVDQRDVALGGAVASALYRYWQERGQSGESKWLERVLELGQDAVGPVIWVRTLIGLGSQYYAQGEYDRMEAIAKQAEPVCAELGDVIGQARTRNLLALAATYSGRYEEGRELFESVIAMARDDGDRWLEAAALNNLAGLLSDWNGDFETAERLYAQAIEIARALANAYTIGVILGDSSQIAAFRREYERADALTDEALEIFRQLGDYFRIAEQSIRRGHYRIWSGDIDGARGALCDALAVLRASAHPREIARCAEACADFAVSLCEFESALMLFGFSDARRTSQRLARSRPTQERLEVSIASARAALGENAGAAAWESGRNLTPEKALDLAETLLAMRSQLDRHKGSEPPV